MKVRGHRVVLEVLMVTRSRSRETQVQPGVAKQSLVDAEQWTGNHELCVLIDGVVKRFPTAFVKINMPYHKGTVKALCMENPVQELIVGNISGATGVEECCKAEVIQQSKAISDEHEIKFDTQPTQVKNEEN